MTTCGLRSVAYLLRLITQTCLCLDKHAFALIVYMG